MTAQMTPVRSTNVAAVGFDEDTQELIVEFASGASYAYGGQSEATLQDLLNSNSPGSYVARHLRHLPARRIS
jgi:hypothetical protein